MLFVGVTISACGDKTQTSETTCRSPHPTYASTSSSPKIWDYVYYVETCQPYGGVMDNFARERTALEELVRRKDLSAMYELGLQLETVSDSEGGSETERAHGRQLQADALRLGYKPPPVSFTYNSKAP